MKKSLTINGKKYALTQFGIHGDCPQFFVAFDANKGVLHSAVCILGHHGNENGCEAFVICGCPSCGDSNSGTEIWIWKGSWILPLKSPSFLCRDVPSFDAPATDELIKLISKKSD